ncbi:hypothetical protein GGF46_003273 [Coemansia sp. RSA 552]|nr:hypothetical protein GGF46_003273 [Coemansia sp. RSA 552]
MLVETQQFLDDHFPSLESLALVNDLLGEEERRHTKLAAEAHTALATAEECADKARIAAERAQAAALKLVDLHSRAVQQARSLNDGSAGAQLVADLTEDVQALRRLERAKEYADDMAACERLAAAGRAHTISQNPQVVLAACNQAADLAARIEKRGDSLELAAHARQTAHSLWTQATEDASATLDASLRRMGWPGTVDLEATALGDFDASFAALAALDDIGRGMGERTLDPTPLALERLARVVDIRIRYHFAGMRNTGRADRPEWWLPQILAMVRTLMPLLETHVQTLCARTGGPPDAPNELIRLLLPTIRRKLEHDRPTYLDDGLVAARTAHELARFDHALRSVYFFDGPGLLGEFLADDDVFTAWATTEHDAAIDAYTETARETDAFALLYDSVQSVDGPRATCIAHKAVALVEDVATRYAILPGCMRQLQLLAHAQLPVVIALVEDINAEVDQFESESLPFIQGSEAEELPRLASWFHSVWYTEDAVHDWSCDALYVDMWAAVCRHTAATGCASDPRDWRDNCDSWGEDDRQILDNPGHDEDLAYQDPSHDDLNGAGLWDRTLATLAALKQRVLQLMTRVVTKDAIARLRAYRKKTSWVSSDDEASVSGEISTLLPSLSQLVATLAALLPLPPLAQIVRALASDLDTFLVERVACAHPFNSAGGRQFATDVDALSRILRESAPGGALHSLPMCLIPKARECARVLSCSLDGQFSSTEGDIPLSLGDWAPAVTSPDTDEQEAALILKKLAVTHISLKDVRRLIARRADYTTLHGSPL